MLDVRALSVRAGAVTILDQVSLSAAAGEMVALIGPNGAGKSTLCRAAAGDVQPASGGVLIDNRPLASWPRRELARRRAYLPQESSLSLPFSVRDVVLLGRSPHDTDAKARDREIASTLLGELDLTAIAERAYTTLSGGEKQRVQLARVLAQVWEPDRERLLVLDEPTASLDPAHQLGALALTRKWAQQGGAVVLTLHDLGLAARFSDRVVLLNRGRVVASGPPAEVLTSETLSPVFSLPLCVIPHPVHASPIIVPR